MGVVPDDAYRKLNFDICRAVDTTVVGICLDKLMELVMPREQAEAFRAQAQALRALLCTENNRLNGF
jgi:hypothetical protein